MTAATIDGPAGGRREETAVHYLQHSAVRHQPIARLVGMPIAYLGGAAVFVGVLAGILSAEVLWVVDEGRGDDDRLLSLSFGAG